VKPENMIFNKEPTGEVTCKLLDFGLSKKIGQTPSKMGITRDCGTESYRAPEITDGIAHDFKVDVYSLGITIALCMGKEFPVKGASNEIDWGWCRRYVNNRLQRARDIDYPSIRATWAHLSMDMKQLVSLMTRSNPAERISLAEAMTHDFWGEHRVSADELQEIQQAGVATIAAMEAAEAVADLF
jgi:serine/threonine protein kinase